VRSPSTGASWQFPAWSTMPHDAGMPWKTKISVPYWRWRNADHSRIHDILCTPDVDTRHRHLMYQHMFRSISLPALLQTHAHNVPDTMAQISIISPREELPCAGRRADLGISRSVCEREQGITRKTNEIQNGRRKTQRKASGRAKARNGAGARE